MLGKLKEREEREEAREGRERERQERERVCERERTASYTTIYSQIGTTQLLKHTRSVDIHVRTGYSWQSGA